MDVAVHAALGAMPTARAGVARCPTKAPFAFAHALAVANAMPATGHEGGALNAAAGAVETHRADALAVVITLTSAAARAKRSASSVAMLTVVPLAARASSRRIARAVAVVAHCRAVAIHVA